MRTLLVYDRNGDPVYEDTPLHEKDGKTPTNRIRQDEQNPECIIFTDLNGKDDRTFHHPNGFGQEPRLLKSDFKSTWWQVKPYN